MVKLFRAGTEGVAIVIFDPGILDQYDRPVETSGNKWMTPKDFEANIHTDVTRAWRL